MASLTNCWPTVLFLLPVTLERWVLREAHSSPTDRFLLRVILEQWVLRVVRSCRSHSNRSLSLVNTVKLPGDRHLVLEPGNAS